jgi:hypothetical protein
VYYSRNQRGQIVEIGLDGAYYTALVDTNASDLFSDATKFETGEKKRNALMKRHVIKKNIALYGLHSELIGEQR